MAIFLSDAKIEAVEKIIQYEFQDKRLLEQAFEAAGSTSRPEGNKRLAQLGDATLRLSLNLAGFEAKRSIGHITISLSKKANNDNLASIGFAFGLDKIIILNPSAQGAVPKRLMATTVEALIGAVYLDSQKSIKDTAINSPADLDSTKLLPELPVNEKPVCAIQLNGIEGVLILAFTMSHTTGDWESMRAFLSLVCQGSQAYQKVHNMPVYTPDLKRSAYDGDNKDGISKDELVKKGRGFYLMELGSFVPKTPPPFRTSIYKISQSALADLKAQCTPLGVEYVSSYDCMSPLLWVALTRARTQLHPEKAESQSRLGHPINLRSRDPDNLLSAQYFGNGVFPTMAGPMDARSLLSGDGLSIAASSIRKSINEINMDSIKVTTALVAPLGPTGILGYPVDFHDMDLMMNSWFNGSAQDFVIGDDLAPSTFRTLRPITGACFFFTLPNVSGNGSNDREVFIQLEEKEYEIMRRNEQFSKFFELVVG